MDDGTMLFILSVITGTKLCLHTADSLQRTYCCTAHVNKFALSIQLHADCGLEIERAWVVRESLRNAASIPGVE